MGDARGLWVHGREYYRPCAPAVVPVVTRLSAERLRQHVCQDLRLTRLRLEWFAASLDPLTTGEWADSVFGLLNRAVPTWTQLHGGVSPLAPDVMWIRADLTPYRTAMVVAEEARHVWQHRQGGGLGCRSADENRRRIRSMERDAREYQRAQTPVAKEIAQRARMACRKDARRGGAHTVGRR